MPNKTQYIYHGSEHFEVRTYRAMMRHLALTAVSHLFVARIHQRLKKNPQSDGLPGANGVERLFVGTGQPRRQFLERASEIITLTQKRNAKSERSHRKETLRWLHRIGICISALPRCSPG